MAPLRSLVGLFYGYGLDFDKHVAQFSVPQKQLHKL